MYLTLAYIRKGDYVIDATCGNGGDTAALAEAVGQEGAVLAVDIQKAAVESTVFAAWNRFPKNISRENLLLPWFLTWVIFPEETRRSRPRRRTQRRR